MSKLYKMYELSSKKDACSKKRSFEYVLEEAKGNLYKKAVSIKEAIHKSMDGTISTDAEIDAILEEGFKEIPYASPKQRELLMEDAKKMVKRYVNSEADNLTDIRSKVISVSDDVDVEVTPDFLRIKHPVYKDEKQVSPKTIEIIKIKAGKPDIKQIAAKKDIGLYAMFLYAKEFLLPGDKDVSVEASYYFLRRDDDRFGDNPHFEPDFFAKSGGNVVRYSEVLSYEENYENKIINEIIDTYVEGIPEEECSKADCESCALYDICKFIPAPTAVKTEEKAKSISDISLTPMQEEAINYREGIVRINAGAGAGKTTVIAIRVAAMLLEGVSPESIFLVTFSNSGAKEMRSRIRKMVEGFGIDPEVTDSMTICTFNAFGNEIIKKDFAKVGFVKAPTVIDDTERSAIISRLLNENYISGLNYKYFTESKFALGAIEVAKRVFDICKKGQYGVSDWEEVYDKLGLPSIDQVALRETIALYDKYDDELREKALIEFSDQMVLLLELIHQDPYYMERFKFEHIIVDEFQDSDKDQIEILNLLTETPTFKSLMVVGDDSQAIFGFRDTTPDFIINFDKYMRNQNVDTIDLVENHRSTPEIIEFANKINNLNYHRVFKDLVATRPHGKAVITAGFLEKNDEINYVIAGIKDRLDKGQAPETMAIIVSNNSEVEEMAGILEEQSIPVVTLSPLLLMENSRVKAALALFRTYEDASDTKDCLVYTNASIGGGILKKDTEEIKSLNEAMLERIKAVKALESETDRKEAILQMLNDINPNEDEVYESFLEKIKGRNIEGMIDYIHDFLLFGKNTKRRRECTYPGVVVTTAHSSKGLEWPTVYNMISGYDKQGLSRGYSNADVEEKRRLLFVSATRARDELIITARYTAYGKKGSYTYNQFLMDCYRANGKMFNIASIESERALAAELKKARKEQEKREQAGKAGAEAEEKKASKPRKKKKEEPEDAVKESQQFYITIYDEGKDCIEIAGQAETIVDAAAQFGAYAELGLCVGLDVWG